jgi:hypothetical protein
MNRRSFFKLAIGSAAVAAIAKVVPARESDHDRLLRQLREYRYNPRNEHEHIVQYHHDDWVYSADGRLKGLVVGSGLGVAVYSPLHKTLYPEHGDIIVRRPRRQ